MITEEDNILGLIYPLTFKFFYTAKQFDMFIVAQFLMVYLVK